MSKLERSTVGLREALFEEWELLRAGTSTPSRASAVARMANTILQSVQVEIEYHKYVSNTSADATKPMKKSIDFGGTQIKLGGNENKEAA